MPDQQGNRTAAESFVHELNAKFPVVNTWDETFGVLEGKRYDKIVKERDGKARSVHAFVERATGKLIKAAGWNAPAKLASGEFNSQYNLYDSQSFHDAVEAADPYGSYLYAK